MLTSFTCAVCGEDNETFVDPEGGERQFYTEDCQVCCRPNALRIQIEDETIHITASFEE